MFDLWSLEAHEETSKKKNRLCWGFLCLASLPKIEDYVVTRSTGRRTAVVEAPSLPAVDYIVEAFLCNFRFCFFQVKRQNGKWR